MKQYLQLVWLVTINLILCIQLGTVNVIDSIAQAMQLIELTN